MTQIIMLSVIYNIVCNSIVHEWFNNENNNEFEANGNGRNTALNSWVHWNSMNLDRLMDTNISS